MFDLENIRYDVVGSIKAHLHKPVIRLNQDEKPPKYDYIGYTITTLMKANNGTYGEYQETRDGKNTKVYRKEFQQIWSFTTYSDNDLKSKMLAIQLYDFLDRIGSVKLADKGIVIQRIGDITNRDNLLTMGYEYRNGFDVTFAFMNEIVSLENNDIENFNFTYNTQS